MARIRPVYTGFSGLLHDLAFLSVEFGQQFIDYKYLDLTSIEADLDRGALMVVVGSNIWPGLVSFLVLVENNRGAHEDL